jgi:hypothetical protein
MLSFLESILHGILDLPYLLVGLLVEAINGWILILGSLLTGTLVVLPSFPTIPAISGEVTAGVAWFLPISGMLAVFATFVTSFVVWMGVQIALRWVKAL